MNLSELILAAKADTSYEQLSARCGGTPTAARLQQMATKPLKNFPDPGSIRGMASGFKIGLRAVIEAAAESLDLSLPERRSRLEVLLPKGQHDLTDDQIDRVLDLVNTFIDLNTARSMREAYAQAKAVGQFDRAPGPGDEFQELSAVIDAIAHSADSTDALRSALRGMQVEANAPLTPAAPGFTFEDGVEILTTLVERRREALNRDAEMAEEAVDLASYRSPLDPTKTRKEPNLLHPDEPHVVDEAARDDTGQPNPGEVEDNE